MTNNINSNISEGPDEIDIRQLLKILWEGKVFIIGLTTLFSIAAVVYSLSLPNIYKTTALLSPVNDSSSNQSMKGVGGLASLAGIDINASVGGKGAQALEKLNTLSFFADNIYPNIFLPDLMAIESWDAYSNSISYENDLYDSKNKTWIRNYKHPKSQIPSPQESFKAFKKKLNIAKDQNGFIAISVKHQSPFIAKEWTELIVNKINDFFRSKDKLEAQAAIDFLNTQITQTSYTEIKQVIASLLQQKMQQMTLIEANEFYIFSYIDPPMVMEEKLEPVRSKISILGAILGGLLGILIIIIRNYVTSTKLKN